MKAENGEDQRRRVLIFAVRDQKYPRHLLLKEKLLQVPGVEIEVVPINWNVGQLKRAISLFAAGWRKSRSTDAIFVAEFGLQYAPLAWIISRMRGAQLVVDHFVGTYETHVLDHRTYTRRSVRGRYFAAVDRVAYRLADIATIDTELRARLLTKRFPGRRTRSLALPVGAPKWARSATTVTNRLHDSPLKVLFYGNYLPLHGVPFVIEALAHLPKTMPFGFELEIVGSAPGRQAAEDRVAELGLTEVVTFTDAQPEDVLIEKIRKSDVVLGVFGDTFKARTVIPNKVWQGLYMGKTVITRRADSLTELTPLVGPQLVEIDPSDPRSLAKHLASMAQGAQVPSFPSKADDLDQYVERAFRKLFDEVGLNRR
jgi:glycosyltransferase involved in cell wall biosynthesis